MLEGDALERNGLDLVVRETFTPPLSSATPLVQRVRASRPDLFLLLPTAVIDAKLLLEKLNEFGLGKGQLPTISNGSAMGDPDLRSNVNPDFLEGVMSIVANWRVRGQEELTREYIERSGEPWLTQNPICAYGHVWILKTALEMAGRADRHAVAQAIREMDITDGPAQYFPGNRIRFDDHGRRIDAELLVVQWQDGEPKTVYPSTAAIATPIWPSH